MNEVCAEKYWRKVQKTEKCWLWTGSLANGYGKFYLDGWHQKAHRLAYQMLVGPIPDGLELDHLCRVRNCVRPEHLEAVTHAENVLRGDSITVLHGAKTHCPRGHQYTEENLLLGTLHARNARQCKVCQRDLARARYAKNRPPTVTVRRVDVPHGDYLKYRRGCRCTDCRVAFVEHLDDRKIRKGSR